MFRSSNKKSKPLTAKPLSQLTEITLPQKLLQDEKRQTLIQNITELSALGENRFEQIGMRLIHNVVNHCQHLPETLHSFYSNPGGLVDHALNRTEAALQLLSEFIIQEDAALSEEQKLWLYALMSAGLLQGIGKLQIDYVIKLYDLNGQFLKIWNPLIEPTTEIGRYYHYEFESEQEDVLRQRLNLIFARILMPIPGFNWIISNPELLPVWLALLNEDTENAGMLGAILERADAIAIQRYFSEQLNTHTVGQGGRVGTFVDTLPTNIDEQERLIGIEFIQWLMAQLENGKIMINKAPLFMVPGGMLMSVDMFKLFVREHPEFKNWQAIQNGFLALGMHQTNANGQVISRFEDAHSKNMLNGIVFSNYAVALPASMKVYDAHQGGSKTASALEVINSHAKITSTKANTAVSPLSQLGANGQWQLISESASLKQGNQFRG